MGKKGKKAKVTGTGEVIRFKTVSPGKEQYAAMLGIAGCKAQNLAGEYEVLPEVRRDVLTDTDHKKLHRFFTMMGTIASFCKLDQPAANTPNERTFRFRLHHMYLYPVPQYLPFGYKASVILKSRQVIDYPQLKLNNVGFKWDRWKSLDLIEKCNEFLEMVDKASVQIPSLIEENMPDFAGTTLKKFKLTLMEKLVRFENAWVAHEELIMKVWHDIHEDVFAPVVDLCHYEHELSLAEEEGNVKSKQQLEIKLVIAVEKMYNLVFRPKAGAPEPAPWHDKVGPLSEGCVFYETKSSPEHLNMCRHVIKAFIDLRRYIRKIPTARLYEQYDKNEEFVRLLKQFKRAVDDADGALTHTDGLPPIVNFKAEQWMTYDALDEEVQTINSSACKIRDLNVPEPPEGEDDEKKKKKQPSAESMMISMTPEVDQEAAAHRICKDLCGGHQFVEKLKPRMENGMPPGPLYRDEYVKICQNCGYIEGASS
jgi:hypothetical protein